MRMHGCGPDGRDGARDGARGGDRNGSHDARREGARNAARAIWPMAAMAFAGRRGTWGPISWDLDDGAGPPPRRGPGGRDGRGGRRRMFGSGELRLVLLHLIAETPRHGYELIKAIEELTGGAYAPSPGVVYPTLSLLTDEGAIAEHAEDGSPRKAFAVTPTGSAELAERADEAAKLIARLTARGEEDEQHKAPPIARAVGNLFAALRHRAADGDFDRDTVHKVAEILDEAAQKIERL